MTSDDQVTEWALAAGAGDRAALERFIRATQRDVWRFLAYLSGPAAADDLAQETYLRAMRSLPRFAARSPALTWLLAIARRAAADQVRAAKARPRLAPVAGEVAAGPAVPGFDEGVALRGLLDSLADERRTAFVLTQIIGLSYAEAAAVCGCPTGTIRSRVARAREDLVALIDEADQPLPSTTRRRTPPLRARTPSTVITTPADAG